MRLLVCCGSGVWSTNNSLIIDSLRVIKASATKKKVLGTPLSCPKMYCIDALLLFLLFLLLFANEGKMEFDGDECTAYNGFTIEKLVH